MGKKERLQDKYEKMLKDFNAGHSKLKKLKDDMRLLRIEINNTPKNLVDERPDEVILKEK